MVAEIIRYLSNIIYLFIFQRLDKYIFTIFIFSLQCKIVSVCIGSIMVYMKPSCLIIAEVAQAHDGSLGAAHAFIDAIADAGADAVKFQTHIADAESTPNEQWRIKFSKQDETRYDYWKRIEFTESQWIGLKQHADERNILFLSSPFSIDAVDLLSRIGVSMWKIASGEVSNLPMLEHILQTHLPIILSSGMSSFNELDTAVDLIRAKNVAYSILQCTTAYPCPPEKIGLNILSEISERYNCSYGLSDHSGTIFPSLAAVTLGATIVEVHVTFSKQSFGPDTLASITISDLKQLTEGIRFIEKMQSNPVDKDSMANEMLPLYQLFTKSIVTKVALPKGTILENKHLAFKKPGTGIRADQVSKIIGCRLTRDVSANELIDVTDIEIV